MGYGTNRNTARMMELPQTKVVHIQENQQNVHPHPAEFLQGDKGTRLVSDQDKGSRPKYARVEVQGEPCLGIVDIGSDITIIGGDLF